LCGGPYRIDLLPDDCLTGIQAGQGGARYANYFKAGERLFGDESAPRVPDLFLPDAHGFVHVMESRVVTPRWAIFFAFAVFTAIIRDDPLPKRSARERNRSER
jgi:hypothetical protein